MSGGASSSGVTPGQLLAGVAIFGVIVLIVGVVTLVRSRRNTGLAVVALLFGVLMALAPFIGPPLLELARGPARDQAAEAARVEAFKRRGARAALELARIGQAEVGKFLARDQDQAWRVVSLAGRPELAVEGLWIQEAIVCCEPRNTLVATMNELPQSVVTVREEPLADPELARVRCQYGAVSYQFQEVPCWQFTVPIEVAGRPEVRASAVLIVRER